MALIKLPSDGDWIGLRICLQKLATIRLGADSAPVFDSMTVNSNVTVSTFDAASAVIDAGVISSFVTTSEKADYALITTLAVMSATISAGSFTSVFATKATITTLATVSASISALTVVSGFFSNVLVTAMTVMSAVISAMTATSVFATRATLSTAVIKRLLVGGIVS